MIFNSVDIQKYINGTSYLRAYEYFKNNKVLRCFVVSNDEQTLIS